MPSTIVLHNNLPADVVMFPSIEAYKFQLAGNAEQLRLQFRHIVICFCFAGLARFIARYWLLQALHARYYSTLEIWALSEKRKRRRRKLEIWGKAERESARRPKSDRGGGQFRELTFPS